MGSRVFNFPFMRNILFFSLFSFSLLGGVFAADNTELLDREGTATVPKFSYQTFTTCSEFEGVMKKILPKTGNNYPYY